jgi:hypothetical protein
MRKSVREKMLDAKKGAFSEAGQMSLEELVKLLVAPHKKKEDREINPTQWEFIMDGSEIEAYMGPAGCAKTSTLMAKCLIRAMLKPGFKGLVSRNDYNDLLGTTAARAEEMLNALPKGTLIDRDKSPPMKWILRPALPDAPLAEITFMGLKESLGSYEFTDAFIDEADEVDVRRLHEVKTRLRAPDIDGQGHTLNLCFNPPAKTHELYTACTGLNAQGEKLAEPWMKVYRPEPRENARNLPKNYYENMVKHLPEDMLQRLRDGEWGSTFEGQPVYREFVAALHVRDQLVYTPHKPMYRFWDFGYKRPYCVWAQLDFFGRLLHFKEILGFNEEAKPFARRCIAQSRAWFPDMTEWIDYGDPAANQHKDTGSTLQVLRDVGIDLKFRPSLIEYGVRLIRQLLQQVQTGEPLLQYDRRGVPVLIDAFKGGYRMDDRGDKPKKDGFYDHPQDGERYGIINIFGATGNLMPSSGSLPGSIAYGSGG